MSEKEEEYFLIKTTYTCHNCGKIMESFNESDENEVCPKCGIKGKEGINITDMLQRIYKLEEQMKHHIHIQYKLK